MRAALSGLVVALALAGGCISAQERKDYYQAQLDAMRERKPLLEIEAKDGEELRISGLKTLRVYAPNGEAVQQLRDQAAEAAREGLGIAGAVATVYVGGEAAVGLADVVGKHAGHTLAVSGAGAGGVIGGGVALPQTATPVVVKPEIVTQPEPVIVNPVVVPSP